MSVFFFVSGCVDSRALSQFDVELSAVFGIPPDAHNWRFLSPDSAIEAQRSWLALLGIETNSAFLKTLKEKGYANFSRLESLRLWYIASLCVENDGQRQLAVYAHVTGFKALAKDLYNRRTYTDKLALAKDLGLDPMGTSHADAKSLSIENLLLSCWALDKLCDVLSEGQDPGGISKWLLADLKDAIRVCGDVLSRYENTHVYQELAHGALVFLEKFRLADFPEQSADSAIPEERLVGFGGDLCEARHRFRNVLVVATDAYFGEGWLQVPPVWVQRAPHEGEMEKKGDETDK